MSDGTNLAQLGNLPPELYQQQQELNRQQQMAAMLMRQNQQPQGQMISGRYVAPSWAQSSQPVANMFAGAYLSKKGDERAQELAKALKSQYTDELHQFNELLAKNPSEAYSYASQAYHPKLQEIGLKKMIPQEFDLNEGQRRFMTMPDGTIKEIAAGGEKIAPEVRQAMQMLGINKPLNQLSPQEVNAIRNEALAFKKAGAVSINMPSESERKAGTMVNILDKNLQQMQVALGVDPTAVKPNVPASIVAAIAGPNALSRAITPEQRQVIEDSQLDVLDAALTLRTGAAYTREQLRGMRDTYFPGVLDKPAAVQAKKQRLETLLDSAYISAGRATPPRTSTPYVAPPKPNANKELNIPSAPTAPKFLGFE